MTTSREATSEPTTVPFVSTVAELRAITARWRKAGDTIALIPTMGALHEGHLALAREGHRRCRRVVASIFVNPTQFAPTEDFSSYPRTFDSDRAKLSTVGCDLVWAPTVPEMYPDGFATRVVPEGAARGLESDFRPHFFGGVATVCCKLFTQVGPDVAVFGEKDYQQLQVVKQMVRDLNLPLEIVGHETVREPDGLAMSSRNAYLSAEERRTAREVPQALKSVIAAVRAGTPVETACLAARDALTRAGFKVDYVEVRDAISLGAPDPAKPRRALVAAWLGRTRLIDNMAV